MWTPDLEASSFSPLDAEGSGLGASKEPSGTPIRRTPMAVMRSLALEKQVLLIAATATVANTAYAFLEPTIGAHVLDSGQVSNAKGVGALFAVASLSYTLACPAAGVLSMRVGTRMTILFGQSLLAMAFATLSLSAALAQEEQVRETGGPRIAPFGPSILHTCMVLLHRPTKSTATRRRGRGRLARAPASRTFCAAGSRDRCPRIGPRFALVDARGAHRSRCGEEWATLDLVGDARISAYLMGPRRASRPRA